MIKHMNYVDPKTGEVIFTKVQSLDFMFPDDKGYRMFNQKHTVRMFPDIDFPEGLTDRDELYLYRLARKIIGDSCMIGYRSGGSIKPAQDTHIQSVTGLGDERFRKWISKMMRLGMIARLTIEIEDQQHTQYYMSPLYFFSGKFVSLNLYLLFQEQLDQHLPEWAKAKYREMAERDVK